MSAQQVDTSLRTVFAGRRGRLLAALLLAEFAAAVQGIAYAGVLPVANQQLHGDRLYGATLAAGTLVSVVVLAAGSGIGDRLGGPRRTLFTATAVFVAGVALTAAAPAMGWLLAGTALRGLAGGLLAAFGLSAVGGLFEDAVRPRVLGLFALVWLLPSLIGPPVNAALTVSVGWRWAMAWPVVVVIAARALVGRDVDLIPAGKGREPVALGLGLVVAGGLLLASVATGAGRWGIPLLVAGLLTACVGGVRVLSRPAGGNRRRVLVLWSFAAVVTAFLGGDGLVPKALYTGLGSGVVAYTVALAAGWVAWSVTGARPPTPRPGFDPAVVGTALVTLAVLAEAAVQTRVLGDTGSLAAAVGAWAVGGLGMGLAYGRLQPEAFDDLPAEQVAPVATAVAFAETAAAVVGSLLGGGTYSLATTAGVSTRPALVAGFLLLGAAGLAAVVMTRLRTGPRADTSS